MILFLVICLSDLFLERILKVKLLIEQRKKFTVSVNQAFEREASITQEIIFFFLSKKQRERTIIKRDDWRSKKLRRNENGSRNRVSHRLFRVTHCTTLFGFVFMRVAARNCIKGFLHDLSVCHSYAT